MDTRMNFYERLNQYIGRDNECWIWPGALRYGYGVASLSVDKKPKTFYTHRLAYAAMRGEIPAGKQIDHLCRNRACFNPAHLEAVTQQVNIARGQAGINNKEKDHCKQGHELSGMNVSVRTKPNGKTFRVCLACKRNRWHAVEKHKRIRKK
jgi:hypothetical protein